MHELHDLRDMLCKELKSYGAKGELTAASLDVVDKLAHAVKNLDRVIDATGGGYSGDYMRRTGGMDWERYPRGYSRRGGMVDELRDMMDNARDEHTRQELQRFISRLEGM